MKLVLKKFTRYDMFPMNFLTKQTRELRAWSLNIDLFNTKRKLVIKKTLT